MQRSALRRPRQHLPRALSVLLVLVIGGLGLAATRSAGNRAIQVHRDDQLQLQRLLASLTTHGAYASFSNLQSLLEGQELAGGTRFSGVRNAPADLRLLRAVLERGEQYDAGAAVVNGSGEVFAQWSPTGVLPNRDDPGLTPLVDALMAPSSALPMSGVVQAGGTPVGAVGAPVSLRDGSTGAFIAFYDLRSSTAQALTEQSFKKYGVDGWVVDPRGLALAAPTSAGVGKPLPLAGLRDALPASGHGLLDISEAGVDHIATYADVQGTAWRVASAQPRERFEGALQADSRRAQVLVVLLLLLAGGGMARMHRRRESALQEVADTDELTGVLNRRGWFAAATQELERSARAGEQRMLLFVDLDGLKQVNDVLGHREGDRAIVDAAAVLRRAAGRGDLVGRLGGDEFVVLAGPGRDAPTRRVLDALGAHNESSGAAFDLRFSLGLETWDAADPCSVEELVRRADAVMYVDKTSRPERRQGVVRPRAPQPVDQLVF